MGRGCRHRGMKSSCTLRHIGRCSRRIGTLAARVVATVTGRFVASTSAGAAAVAFTRVPGRRGWRQAGWCRWRYWRRRWRREIGRQLWRGAIICAVEINVRTAGVLACLLPRSIVCHRTFWPSSVWIPWAVKEPSWRIGSDTNCHDEPTASLLHVDACALARSQALAVGA